MKKIMQYYKTIILMLMLFAACSPNEGPYSEVSRYLNISVEGDNQKTRAGENFPNVVTVYVSGFNQSKPDEQLSVRFEIKKGNGRVSDREPALQHGMASVTWQSGSHENIQQLSVIIKNAENEELFEKTIHGFAFRNNAWDTVVFEQSNPVRALLVDTLRQQSIMWNGCNLLTQSNDYFNWLDTVQFQGNCPRNLVITPDHNYLASGRDNNLYISTDGAQSWEIRTNPFPATDDAYDMFVTNEGTIWASRYNHWPRIRRSVDNAQSWSNADTGVPNEEGIQDIYALGADTFYMLTNYTKLYRSTDGGHVWQPIEVPGNPLKFYITPTHEFILINQDNGISVYKSTDYGQTYQRKFTVMPEYGTTMRRSIVHAQDSYYVLIPGYGILHTSDFEEFTDFYLNTQVTFLWRDHLNTLIADCLSANEVYYYHFE